MNRINKQRGLNLVEVLVTLTITSIGLMGLVSLQMQSIKATQDTGNRAHAIWLHNDLANRIRANATGIENYVTDGVACPGNAAVTCTNYSTGSSQVTALAAPGCNAEQMALWDLQEVACGTPRDQGVWGSPVSTVNLGSGSEIIGYLPRLQVSVTCSNPARCSDGVFISLNWRGKDDGNLRNYGDNILVKP